MKKREVPTATILSVFVTLCGGLMSCAQAADVTAIGTPSPGLSSDQPQTLPAVKVYGLDSEDPNGPGRGYVATRTTTGSKTDSAVITNPQSISTVTLEQMEDQGVHTIDEALRYTTGVYTQDGTDIRFDQLRARGFNMDSYLNGLSLFQSPRFATPRIDPYFLERIDVLYGPSSVLYGQGSPGGLVNYVSKLPLEEPYHEIMMRAGSHDSYDIGFDFSGPVDKEGRILYRIVGVGRDAHTQVSTIKDERLALAPSLTIRPDSDTTLTLMGGIQRDPEGGLFNPVPSSGTLFSNPNGRLAPDRYFGDPTSDHMDRDQYWVGYQFRHRFNDTWSVSQNLRYLHINQNYYQTSVTSDFGPDDRTVLMWGNSDEERWDQFGVDTHAQAQLRTGDVAHTILLGVDYRRVLGHDHMANAVVGNLDLYSPNYSNLTHLEPDTRLSYSLTQIGTYAQDEMRYHKWLLTLGAREDWATTNQDTGGSVLRSDDRAFTWRAGLAYEFSNGVVPYVSYATSFQPVLGAASDGSAFIPTKGSQFEAGVRYQPKSFSGYFRLSAYDLRQDNVTTAGPNNIQEQTGQVRSRGIEAEARANITEEFKLIASYAYVDQKVTRDATFEDKRPTIVPRHNAAAWGDYTFHHGPLHHLGFGVGVRYMGRSAGDRQNSFEVPSRTLVDAGAHYDWQKWRFALNVSNLFDRDYISYCTTPFICYWGASRTMTATARYQW